MKIPDEVQHGLALLISPPTGESAWAAWSIHFNTQRIFRSAEEKDTKQVDKWIAMRSSFEIARDIGPVYRIAVAAGLLNATAECSTARDTLPILAEMRLLYQSHPNERELLLKFAKSLRNAIALCDTLDEGESFRKELRALTQEPWETASEDFNGVTEEEGVSVGAQSETEIGGAPTNTRALEREILSQITKKLIEASNSEDATALREAAQNNQLLWSVFVRDLASEDNHLPPELRGQLIEIGQTVIRETAENIDGTLDVEFLVSINQAIIEGLTDGQEISTGDVNNPLIEIYNAIVEGRPLKPEREELAIEGLIPFGKWARPDYSEAVTLIHISQPSVEPPSNSSDNLAHSSAVPLLPLSKQNLLLSKWLTGGEAFDRVILRHFYPDNSVEDISTVVAVDREVRAFLRLLTHNADSANDDRFKLLTSGRASDQRYRAVCRSLVNQKILSVEDGWYKVINRDAVLSSKVGTIFWKFDSENRILYRDLLRGGKSPSSESIPLIQLSAFLFEWSDFLAHELAGNQIVINTASTILHKQANPDDLAIDTEESTQTFFGLAVKVGCFELVRSWLSEGNEVAVNWTSPNGQTALFYAPWSGNSALTPLLLERGAIVNLQGSQGWTPFLVACYCGNLSAVEYLHQAGAEVHTSSPFFGNACTIAARQGHLSILLYLVERCQVDVHYLDESRSSPLVWAVRGAYPAIVKYLLHLDEKRADWNEESYSLLKLAVHPMNSDLVDEQLSIVHEIATIRPELINSELVERLKRFEQDSANYAFLDINEAKKTLSLILSTLINTVRSNTQTFVEHQILEELVALCLGLVGNLVKSGEKARTDAIFQSTKALEALVQEHRFSYILERIVEDTIQALVQGKEANTEGLLVCASDIARPIIQKALVTSQIIWQQLGLDESIWLQLLGDLFSSVELGIETGESNELQQPIIGNGRLTFDKENLDGVRKDIFIWGRDKASLSRLLLTTLSIWKEGDVNSEDLVSEIISTFKELRRRYSLRFFKGDMHDAGIAASSLLVSSVAEVYGPASEYTSSAICDYLILCCHLPLDGNL